MHEGMTPQLTPTFMIYPCPICFLPFNVVGYAQGLYEEYERTDSFCMLAHQQCMAWHDQYKDMDPLQQTPQALDRNVLNQSQSVDIFYAPSNVSQYQKSHINAAIQAMFETSQDICKVIHDGLEDIDHGLVLELQCKNPRCTHFKILNYCYYKGHPYHSWSKI